MAVKKPKPRKFKQARKDAKSAAKSTFSGKAQARLKDPNLRLTADDKEALDEMKKMAKSDLGDKAYLNKKEYNAQQKAAREEFRSKMRAEFGEYGGKKATDADVQAPKRTMTEKAKANVDKTKGKGMNKTRTFVQATEVKPQGKVLKKKPVQGVGGTAGTVAKPKPGLADQIKKDVAKVKNSPLGERRLEQMKKAGISEADAKKVLSTNKPAYQKTIKSGKVKKTMGQISKAVTDSGSKPATKGYSAGKSLTTEAGKARYNELIKQGIKPKSAMNKALFFESKKTAAKPAAELPKMSREQMKAQNKKALDGLKKDIESVKQGTKKTAAAKPKVKKPSVKKPAAKSASTASKVGKAALNAAKTTATIVGPGKFLKAGALVKGAIGASKAVRVGKAVKAAEGTKKIGAANAARKAVNAEKAAKVAAQGKKGKLKRVAKGAALFGAVGLVPTDGFSKPKRQMSKPKPAATTRSKGPAQQSPGQRAAIDKANLINAGGTTTSYTVKKGDTLSAIAKNAGTTLADIRKANPKLMTDAKYKQGNVIWSGTKVKLPKKK